MGSLSSKHKRNVFPQTEAKHLRLLGFQLEFPISSSVTEPRTVLLDLHEDTASLTRASCAFLIKQSPVMYDRRRFFGVARLGNEFGSRPNPGREGGNASALGFNCFCIFKFVSFLHQQLIAF